MELNKWQRLLTFVEGRKEDEGAKPSIILSSLVTNAAIINNAVKESIIKDIDTVILLFIMMIIIDLPMDNKNRGSYMEIVGEVLGAEDASPSELKELIKLCFNSFNQKHNLTFNRTIVGYRIYDLGFWIYDLNELLRVLILDKKTKDSKMVIKIFRIIKILILGV